MTDFPADNDSEWVNADVVIATGIPAAVATPQSGETQIVASEDFGPDVGDPPDQYNLSAAIAHFDLSGVTWADVSAAVLNGRMTGEPTEGYADTDGLNLCLDNYPWAPGYDATALVTYVAARFATPGSFGTIAVADLPDDTVTPFAIPLDKAALEAAAGGGLVGMLLRMDGKTPTGHNQVQPATWVGAGVSELVIEITTMPQPVPVAASSVRTESRERALQAILARVSGQPAPSGIQSAERTALLILSAVTSQPASRGTQSLERTLLEILSAYTGDPVPHGIQSAERTALQLLGAITGNPVPHGIQALEVTLLQIAEALA